MRSIELSYLLYLLTDLVAMPLALVSKTTGLGLDLENTGRKPIPDLIML